MAQYFLRAAAFAALSSIVGYVLLAYRSSMAHRQREEDRAALERWASDGGGNLAGASGPDAGRT